MSRERNLLKSIEGFPSYLYCPDCQSLETKTASKGCVKESLGRYIIDIFTDKWLECKECGATWRKPDKEDRVEDEDREGHREDPSV